MLNLEKICFIIFTFILFFLLTNINKDTTDDETNDKKGKENNNKLMITIIVGIISILCTYIIFHKQNEIKKQSS
jgi:amino acid permease